MRAFIKIVLIWLVPLFSTAQVNPIFIVPTATQADSLKVLVKQTTNDTIRMASLRDLALHYLDISSDSALAYIEQELPLTEKLKLNLWRADAMDLYSVILTNLGNYPKALKTFNTALQLAKEDKAENGIWRISKFTPSGIPENARLNMLAAIQMDLGNLYRSSENYDRAVSAYRESERLAKLIGDYTIQSIIDGNKGNLFRNTDLDDSSIYYYKRALEYAEKCGYKQYAGSNLNGLAEVYMRQEKFNESRRYIDSTINVSIQQYNQMELGFSYSLLGQLFSKTGEPDSAVLYGYRGMQVVKATGRAAAIAGNYARLAKIYTNLKRFDSAFIYLQLAYVIKDSLNSADKIKQFQTIGFDEALQTQVLEKEKIRTQSRVRTYLMLAGIGMILLVTLLLYRNNRQRYRANKVLQQTLNELQSAQARLVQSEKMASLGELTAGIAHEIQNPLNFINNFSELNKEMLEELKTERLKPALERDAQAEDGLINDVIENEQKINHHGKRADAIIKGMLQHSQKSTGEKLSTDINALADEYLRLAYHGLRAKDKTFNATLETDYDKSIPRINIAPPDIGRVVLNLITNAFYAVSQRKIKEGDTFNPGVLVQTKKIKDTIAIIVKDNGEGIPPSIIDKIFQPFFTTKPTGQGTGLGLSLSYDIVKAHNGELKVTTKEGEGSLFTIVLPI